MVADSIPEFDGVDALVLYAESLPLFENLEHMADITFKQPMLVTHPSVRWWCTKHANDMLDNMKTPEHQARSKQRISTIGT